MNKLKISALILFYHSIFFSSCSFLIKQSSQQPPQHYKTSSNSNKTVCLDNRSQDSYFTAHASLHNEYAKFIKDPNVLKNKLDFIEKTILWSLLQLYVGPHTVSPSSRLQFFLWYNNQNYYFDFFTQQEKKDQHSWPFLDALYFLQQKFQTKRNLQQLASILDENFHYKVKIGPTFHRFLKENKSQLKQHSYLQQVFFKGDEILQINETMPRVSYKLLIKKYLKNRSTKASKKYVGNFSNLFQYHIKSQKDLQVHCNVDLKLYEHSIYLINKHLTPGHIFGHYHSAQNGLLAVSSQNLPSIQNIPGTFFLQGLSHEMSSTLCSIKNNHFLINLISSYERDSGQHLYHLIRNNLHNIQSLNEIDAHLKKARYLFLANPLRLIFESSQGNKKQLEELFQLGIPIYHATKLGHIQTYAHFHKNDEFGFILDPRRKSYLYCSAK